MNDQWSLVLNKDLDTGVQYMCIDSVVVMHNFINVSSKIT